MIKIIFCKKKIKKRLIIFLKKNWPRENIVFKKKKLFNWMYFDKKKNQYNFLISIKQNKIISCLGITKFNFKGGDLKGSIWLTFLLSKRNQLMAGLNIINYTLKKYHNYLIGGVGVNKNVLFLYKFLGFRVGTLNHFFFPNPKVKNFHILKYNYKKQRKQTKKNNYLIIKHGRHNFFNKIINLKFFEKKFLKNKSYFKKKYTLNPFYNYDYLIVKQKSKIFGFFIVRKCTYLNKGALRVVEFFGDVSRIKFLKKQLEEYIINSNCEYLDFYCHGISEKFLKMAGFEKNKFSKKIIVPNYFEPFQKKNVELPFVIYPKKKFLPIFKGDADQDRPNRF